MTEFPTITQVPGADGVIVSRPVDAPTTVKIGESLDLTPILNMILQNYSANTGIEPEPLESFTFSSMNVRVSGLNYDQHTNYLPVRFYIDQHNVLHTSKKAYDYVPQTQENNIGKRIGIMMYSSYKNPSSVTQIDARLLRYFTIDVVYE